MRRWLALSALAAIALVMTAQSSFTGRWFAETTTPQGDKRETTFFLQQDGTSLAGAVLNGIRMQNISEGKVTGNEASWVVVARFGDQERRLEYHAILSGDRLDVSMPGFGPNAARRELTAKKISSDGTPVHPFASLPKVTLPSLHSSPRGTSRSSGAPQNSVTAPRSWSPAAVHQT